jgi:hypothetical protein
LQAHKLCVINSALAVICPVMMKLQAQLLKIRQHNLLQQRQLL